MKILEVSLMRSNYVVILLRLQNGDMVYLDISVSKETGLAYQSADVLFGLKLYDQITAKEYRMLKEFMRAFTNLLRVSLESEVAE